jgi:hypothetical protein
MNQEAAMAAQQSQGTSFVVHLNDVDITEEQKVKIARTIQGAVLTEIARADFGRGDVLGPELGIRIPYKEWYGLWLERVGRQNLPVPNITFGPR